MANTLEQDIIKVLTETRDEIKRNMEARKVNASGRTSESLRVEQYDGGVRLVGGYAGTHTIDNSPSIYGSDTAPIPTLEVGREGGKVPKGFYYIIREWSKEKGLRFSSESERNTFAYFVSKKIAREGTQRHNINLDVYSTPVMNARTKIEYIISKSLANTLRAALGGVAVSSLRGAFTE